MKWLRLFAGLIICVGMMLSTFASATIDAYPFADESKEKQFYELINELRCPKCQNQTISDSDAPLSKDLKDKTYEMVQQGADKEAVIRYMVDRYGNFVYYQPPLQSSTWFLWFGPFLFLAVAIAGVVFVVRSKSGQVEKRVHLSDEERAKLAELMKSKSEHINKGGNS